MIKFLQFLSALSLYRWLKPIMKNTFILLVVILATIYSHNEYLKWSDLTNNKDFVGPSFIIKNILLVFAVSVYFILIRIQSLKNDVEIKQKKQLGDGFDKFREKKKLKTKAQQILDK
tara:strand:+ start:1997 stop:2347 length:351 start_codon:yes stop_codon:yes gene_type:complete